MEDERRGRRRERKRTAGGAGGAEGHGQAQGLPAVEVQVIPAADVCCSRRRIPGERPALRGCGVHQTTQLMPCGERRVLARMSESYPLPSLPLNSRETCPPSRAAFFSRLRQPGAEEHISTTCETARRIAKLRISVSPWGSRAAARALSMRCASERGVQEASPMSTCCPGRVKLITCGQNGPLLTQPPGSCLQNARRQNRCQKDGAACRNSGCLVL